jgi:hypothetical protein
MPQRSAIAPQRAYGLSKSRIAAFEQCPRRLWLQVHRPELASFDDGADARVAAGHAVGDLACTLVPGGVMVEIEPDMASAITQTQTLMAAGDRPIFEGTFVHDGVLVRVDIMVPVLDDAGGTAWHIAEVKSSTAPKPPHVGDLATQIWVLEQCGVSVASASVRHIDNSFRLAEPNIYEGLFKDAELSEAIEEIKANRAVVVAAARIMLAGEEPMRARGGHCSTPYQCEFGGHCGKDEPLGPKWPIAELPYSGRALAEKWASAGIQDIRGLPRDAGLNLLHERVRGAVCSGWPFIDAVGAAKATESWTYPRIWLDFETISFVIPRWIGTRPYGQVPFQFSAHIEEAHGEVRHVEYLSLDGSDPRAGIAGALAALPATGSVIAYNAGFERGCLRDLAEAVSMHTAALLALAERTVDLLPVARAHYYHREQRGSWSIKPVLKSIAPELDYAPLDVGDGEAAQMVYLEAIDPGCTPERREAIAAALRTYCARDTYAMIVVLRKLLHGYGSKFVWEPGDIVLQREP